MSQTSASTRQELGVIAQHAKVIGVGQLATMAYGVTDAVVAGRYSDEALATLAVASSIFISIYVGLMSVMQALMPIYSELNGAKKPLELGKAFRQSLYLGLALMLFGMAVMMQSGIFLEMFGVPEKLRPGAVQYLSILGWALIPTLGFRMFGALNQSLGAPRIVMQIQIAALAFKIPLTVWFVFGGLGLPAMGVVGCAWASFAVNCLTLIAAGITLHKSSLYKPLALFAQFESPNWKRLKTYMALGVPAGLASFVEVTSYALMGLLVARMGVIATASHQIAASVAAVLFMMPLSLSIASSARVSYWMGAGNPALAGALARSALKLTVGVALCASSVMALLAVPIANLYSSSPEVAKLGASLLLFVALYHVADAWQTIGCFLLRCWRITVMPLIVYGLTLWGLGLGGGFVLAYQGLNGIAAWQQPAAFWLMGFVALCLAASAFQWRIWQLTKPPT
ncbi:MATE family efflux transporter [Variovorax sp. PCZ-1]|uniref:MATE family efflux transporter n=1 Tax=Variovorax sp. PCZ-1 TaxID=2835533 RepID=UPI001BCD456A|nr:MATE family efflux transporter [Variovorax sp. PCZ-1]